MSILTTEELLGLCVDELPQKTIELENGGEVVIKALKGSDTSRIFSLPDMDDKIRQTLSKGLVEPRLRGHNLQKFLDYAPASALEIFTEILSLSNALNEEEVKTFKEAKKRIKETEPSSLDSSLPATLG